MTYFPSALYIYNSANKFEKVSYVKFLVHSTGTSPSTEAEIINCWFILVLIVKNSFFFSSHAYFVHFAAKYSSKIKCIIVCDMPVFHVKSNAF